MSSKEKTEQLNKACNLIIDAQYKLDNIEEVRTRDKAMVDKMNEINKVNIFVAGFKEMYHYLFKEYWRKLTEEEEKKLIQLKSDLISCGDYIKELIDSDSKHLKKIFTRGGITNKKEYAVAEARVEEIYQDESKKEEVDKLNNLLIEYLKKNQKV